ncbi:hypothetical protein I2I05_21340 [Hymenobacter sp. BT683]|uniref:Uncharacterized protein n=1 Tax=Hymenobacter jeongseonensis TaxID=2791027 RepID=A0ABS0INJ7_9BACT|nr:hypothetical protein [Hymenobacter jeongseonensis]MBF9239950.1 hypothetical protein [Hymenobacter jeongseonensis]
MPSGQPVPVSGDGSIARDYTIVSFAVDGISRGVDYLLTWTGVYETINLGNYPPVPLVELIQAVSTAVGVAPRLQHQPMQLSDVDLTCADSSKARRRPDYAPQTTPEAGLSPFTN